MYFLLGGGIDHIMFLSYANFIIIAVIELEIVKEKASQTIKAYYVLEKRYSGSKSDEWGAISTNPNDNLKHIWWYILFNQNEYATFDLKVKRLDH